jgi:hypothetical protein
VTGAEQKGREIMEGFVPFINGKPKFERIADYTIVNLCKSPSMNVEKIKFNGTFGQAVEAARHRFISLLEVPEYDVKTVRVCDSHGLHTWFKIEVLLGGVHETNFNLGADYRRVDGAE